MFWKHRVAIPTDETEAQAQERRHREWIAAFNDAKWSLMATIMGMTLFVLVVLLIQGIL